MNPIGAGLTSPHNAAPAPTGRIAALLLVATFAVFLPSLRGGFVMDDHANLVANPHLNACAPGFARWAFTTFHYGHFQPLSWLSLGLDATWANGRPWAFRLTNLGLHALNALLVWRLLYVLLESAGTPGSSRRRAEAALVGALFFAWHPLRMESVAYLTERRDLLSTALLVPAVTAYLRAHQPDAANARRRGLARVAALMALSLLAKAWAITLPAVLCALDVWPLRRFRRDRPWRSGVGLIGEKWALWLLAAAFALLAFHAQRATGWMPGPTGHAPGARLLQAGYGLWFYPLKTLWPVRLSTNYELDSLSPGLGLAGLLAAAGLTLVLFRQSRRAPAALCAWICYGLLISPVLGLFQSGNQLVAARYAYVAGLPFAALVAGGWLALARHYATPSARRGVLTGTAGLAALLILATVAESRHWRDDRAVWSRALALDARQYHAHNNLAVLAAADGDAATARAHLDAALTIKPAYAPARANRAHLHWQAGDRVAAWNDIERALRDMPAYDAGWLLRARFQRAEGRLDQADADFTRAAAGVETRATALLERAQMRADRAVASGDWTAAHAAYTEWLALAPDALQPRHDRGVAALRLACDHAALADFEAVLARQPAHWAARYHRGCVLERLGRAAEAVADFDTVIAHTRADDPLHRQARQKRARAFSGADKPALTAHPPL